MRVLPILLVGLVLLVGCGGDDDGDGDGGGKPPAPAGKKTVLPAGLSGDAKQAAETVARVLEAPSGEDACFEFLGADYVKSLGGEEGCAKRFEPLVTGDFDTVRSIGIYPPRTSGVAEVTSSGGRQRVMLGLAKASTGDWRVSGASGLPR